MKVAHLISQSLTLAQGMGALHRRSDAIVNLHRLFVQGSASLPPPALRDQSRVASNPNLKACLLPCDSLEMPTRHRPTVRPTPVRFYNVQSAAN